MKLAVFYLVVAVLYGALALVHMDVAEAIFPFVALLLLAAALYAEALRIRGG